MFHRSRGKSIKEKKSKKHLGNEKSAEIVVRTPPVFVANTPTSKGFLDLDGGFGFDLVIDCVYEIFAKMIQKLCVTLNVVMYVCTIFYKTFNFYFNSTDSKIRVAITSSWHKTRRFE